MIPTWGIQPRFLVLSSFKSDVDSRLRIYPFISNSAAWKLGGGLIYTGLDFVFPLTEPDYDEEAEKVIFSPFVGFRWNLGKKLRLLTELKMIVHQILMICSMVNLLLILLIIPIQ